MCVHVVLQGGTGAGMSREGANLGSLYVKLLLLVSNVHYVFSLYLSPISNVK